MNSYEPCIRQKHELCLTLYIKSINIKIISDIYVICRYMYHYVYIIMNVCKIYVSLVVTIKLYMYIDLYSKLFPPSILSDTNIDLYNHL